MTRSTLVRRAALRDNLAGLRLLKITPRCIPWRTFVTSPPPPSAAAGVGCTAYGWGPPPSGDDTGHQERDSHAVPRHPLRQGDDEPGPRCYRDLAGANH